MKVQTDQDHPTPSSERRTYPGGGFHPDIPEEVLSSWQRIVDLIASALDVPAGLVMRVHPTQIEVFATSHTKGNPYERGELANLNTGCIVKQSWRNADPFTCPMRSRILTGRRIPISNWA